MGPADVTFRLLLPKEYPKDRCCLGCHKAKSHMTEIDGTKTQMRWFYVTGAKFPKQYWGKYCENCVGIANQIGRTKKQIKLRIKDGS